MRPSIKLLSNLIVLLTLLIAIPAQAQFPPPPSGPFADFVEITGTTEVGETLTGTYEYNDPNDIPEDGSIYQWYRFDSEFDPPVPIDGATSITYTLVAADEGKLIVFEVTPSNGTDNGMPTPSDPVGPISESVGGGGNNPPTVSNVSISGTLEVGSLLSGSYDYSDPDNDPESGSLYTWFRSDDAGGTGKTAIGGADANTYTLVTADEGKYMSFSVIPSDGTDAGTSGESVLSGPIQAESVSVSFAGGDGSQGDPYQITTAEQLQEISNNLTDYFILTQNIDASGTSSWNSGAGFEPIGADTPFTGNIDGQGYTVTSLFINRSSNSNVALIATIGEGGVVDSLGIDQGDITGASNTAGLAGENYGTITNSYYNGSVTGTSQVGGLVGQNGGDITASYSTGSVTATGSDIGGLVGNHNLKTINKSYSTSSVNGGDNAGGLVGFANDNIENSFATGAVSGSSQVGGLVGNLDSGIITNSFSTGTVSGSTNIGGFVGLKSGFGAAQNSFWDTDESGTTTAVGAGSTSGITGKTTSQMKTESTYTGASWDFTDVWELVSGVNNGYPIQQELNPNGESANTIPAASNLVINNRTNAGNLPELGDQLVVTYDYSDTDNDPESGTIFQWYRADDASGTNATQIAGATDSTYTVASADLDKFLRVDVTPNDGTDVGTLVSSSYSEVAASNQPPSAGTVTITGTPGIGDTLTADYTYSDPESDLESGTTFQWYVAADEVGTGLTPIAGATYNTYVVTPAEEGAYIRVEVTPNDGTQQGSTSTSDFVKINVRPIAIAGNITGTPDVGETIFAVYEYNDFEDDPNAGAQFRWLVADDGSGTNESTISGETDSSYVVESGDAGKFIRVEITPFDGTSLGIADTSAYVEINIPNNAPVVTNAIADIAVNEDGNIDAIALISVFSDAEDNAADLVYSVTTNSNPDLVNTSIDSNSDELTLTLQSDSSGTSDIMIRATDSGGLSVEDTFTITVTSVNDVPVFVAGANQTIDENSGAQTVTSWATGINPGAANEGGQILSFNISTDNDALFEIGPTVDPVTGTLTYTPAADSFGVASVTIRLSDDGGTTNGGIDTSADQVFTITVEEVLSVDSTTAFITTWRTTTPSESITLYTDGGATVSDFDAIIDWGDGTVEQITGDDPDPSHSYTAAGDYEVRISGTFPHLDLTDNADLVTYGETPALAANSAKLIAVNQWGTIAWESMANMFYQTPNLVTYSASDVPDVSQATSMESMFAFTGLTTSDLSGWDVSTITDFSSMFSNAVSFDGDMSGWVFSSEDYTQANGVNFLGMFNLATSFTGTGLANWDVSNADSMTVMFADASAFNQDLSSWDVSNVTDMFLFAEGAAISTANYSAMLNSWSALDVQDGVEFSVNPTTYDITGLEGRNALVNTKGWIITDDGLTAGTLSVSTTETSPVDPTIVDTLWINLTIDDSVATAAFNPTWTLTPASGMTATGTPEYDESRQQWGYDLSGIAVNELDQEYALDISASVPLENGTSSIEDNFSINVIVPNTGPVVTTPTADVFVNEDGSISSINLTAVFSDVEDTDLTYSVASNSNTALLTTSIDPSTEILSLNLQSDQNGVTDLIIQAEDSQGATAQDTFKVTVNPVNDIPTFIVGADQTLDENSGAQTVTNWATGISAGATNETDQNLTFDISTDNDGLFSVLPAVDPTTGTLTFTPAADAFGVATVTINLSDDGGTLNGGVDTSADQTFTITVEEVLSVDPATAFITTWNTAAPGETVTIPTNGDGVSDYDFTIDWGDGTVEIYSGNEPTVSHTYASAGDYEVLIGGTFPYFAGDETDLSGLISIDQWGNIAWESMEDMFYQATNLVTYSATDTPDLSGVSSLRGMFAFTDLSIADLSGWDVSTVTNFFAMFSGVASFDGDLSDWVFSADPYTEANGLNFNGMFNLASSFTGTGLDTWDVSNADSLATMFADATSFDADLSGWDISNVKDMFLFAQNTSLSTANYTAMLSSWSALSLQNNLDFSVNPTTYNLAGLEGRDILTDTFGWNITDGGLTAGALSLSTTETSPLDTTVTDTLWMDLTIDGTVATAALNPSWTLNPASGITATGTPVYDETRQQWGYDLSGIAVSELDQEYALEISASVSLENGSSSIDDNFSINIIVPNSAPFVTQAIDDVTVDEDASDTSIDDLTSYFADAEESAGDLVYSVETNSNPTLLTALVNNTTDNLTMSYEANAFGTADITVRATDSGGLTADTSFTVTVNAVNDVPIFTKGSDQTVDENSGAQTVDNWASAISPGAANESGQALNFNVSTINNDLFSVLPVIDASTGELSYTPAADAFGGATVTISLSDDAGTTNGGVDTSADQTFTITVNEVLTVDPTTAFVTTWQTTIPGETVTIPTGGGATISDYDAIIDWGDGNIERFTGDDPNPSHTYATAGDYTISIGGTFPHLSPETDGELDQLITIEQWGNNQWESMNRAFAWAKNMEYNATDTPDLSGVTDMGAMFFAAAKFNGEIGNWDVSNITSMGFAFDGASIFNGDISTWNVTNVIGMRDMFQNAAAFNQDLSSWDIRNVTNMLNFMDGTALSTANYNNMLSTWSTLPLTSSVNFSVGTTPYSIAGKNNRDSITDTFGWTITDGGLTASGISLTTTETSPVNPTETDTLWMDFTIDGVVLTDELNPGWTLTPDADMTATGSPVYDETRQQWGYDLSGITVIALDHEYSLNVSASVSLENGSSSVDDNFSINITVPNTAPVLSSAITDFSVDEDAANAVFDLTSVFSDAEQAVGELVFSLVSNSNTHIVNGTVDNNSDELTLALISDSSGIANITIRATDSGGLNVDNSFVLTVNPVNDEPTVLSPIADVSVDENAENTVIDLSTNFSDIETASELLTYTIEVNDNETLVAATVNGSELVLDYQTNQFGTANITVRASDEAGLFVEDSFAITVNEVNNAPTFPEAFDAYDVSEAVYAGAAEEFSVGDQEPAPTGLTFSGDGTKMFVIGSGSDAVVEYTLGVAWDVSKAIYAGAAEEFSVGAQETAPFGLAFNGDGTKMFMIGAVGDAVVEYMLGAAWDVSTAVYAGAEEEFNVAAQETAPFGLAFNGDGTKMFVIGPDDGAVVEYSLGVAWDVSTAVYAGAQEEFNVAAQDLSPTGLTFNGDGTKMFVIGNEDDAVVEYTLGAAWDVSTAIYAGAAEEFSVAIQEKFPYSLTFNRDGTKMFVIGPDDGAVVEYTLASGTPRTATFAENGTGTVIDVNATDGNGGAVDVGLTYSIISGADGSLFNIDASTGILTFKDAPDFDNPADSDKNNVYEVIVQADDGEAVNNTATVTLTITVTNENEAPVVSSPLSDLVVDETDPNTTIDLSSVFTDPEGVSTLTYSAESSNSAIVFAGVVSSEPTLILSYKEFGTATITVTASDGEFSVADTFNVTVNEVLSVDPANAFITTWTTTTTDETVTIPTSGGAEISDFEFIVDWGDGSVERITGDDPDPSHTYATAGTHTVQIEGTFPYLKPNADGGLDQLVSVDQWGNIEWQSMNNSFAWARNMEYKATDVPDLSKVTSTAGMFFAAEKLHGDFSGWNTSTVTDMSFMFDGATIFNGDISTWDVSKVTNMREMFQNADAFNQELSNWNVSSVTNMRGLFQDTDSFNGDLSTWKTGAATNMFGMFANAASFNQDVSGWDVSSVTDFGGMFLNAAKFDQDISNWDITSATRLDNGQFGFLQGTSFSQQNYDLLLHNWNKLEGLPENLSLNVGTAKYGPASAAHGNLTGFKGWTLTDGGRYNMFISIWEVTSEKPTIQLGAKAGDQISDFDFTIDWGDGTVEKFTGDAPIISHTYTEFGAKNIRIAGVFPEMNASAEGATISNLRSVVLWGDIQWESMASMFAGADSLEFRNLDTPDLSSVSSMENMFFSLSNQSSFNSDISGWDVSSVTNMELMFAGAKAFNQDISGWDVSSVTNMGGMFAATESFDQNLGNWNIQNVDTFDFFGTIGSSTVQIDIGFKQDAELSTSNYDSTLIGWAEKVTAISNIEISFGNSVRSIISASSYNGLIDLGWTITDGGSSSEFTTRWQTTSPNETVTIPTGGGNEITDFDFIIDWGDGTIETFAGDDPDPMHTYATAGTYTVMIGGVFPHMNAEVDGDLDQLLSLKSWGSIQWEDMTRMFAWARNMVYNATDAPDLSNATSTAAMFFAAEKVNADLNNWDVSTITDMSFMFDGATAFNGDVTNWNTSNVNTMRDMFQFASSFNQDISGWDVSKVTDLRNMLNNASAFNQELGDWQIGSVEFMQAGSQGFLEGTALSIINYDSLLIKWSEQTLPMNLTLDVDSTNYSRRSVKSRQKIIDDFNWTIIDGGIGLSKIDLIARKDRFSADSVLIIDVLGDDVPLSDSEANFTWTAINLADSTNLAGFVAPTFNADSSYWELETRDIKLNYTTGVNFNISVEVEIPELSVLETGKENVELYNNFYFAENGVTIKAPNAAINEQGFVIIDDEPVTHTRRDRAGLDSLFNENSNHPEFATTVTTGITDMSNLFNPVRILRHTSSGVVTVSYTRNDFNQDIGSWDVSSVTTMARMFSGEIGGYNCGLLFCSSGTPVAFNQDISNWDVSNVTDMSYMFTRATSFNQDISNWNVSNVRDMSGMFSGGGDFLPVTHHFNQDLSGWDVSNVQNMREMFSGAKFDQPIGNWDVSSVIDMSSMFNSSEFDQSIIKWNVSNVKNMKYMFAISKKFNQFLLWDLRHGPEMDYMFGEAKCFNGGFAPKGEDCNPVSAKVASSTSSTQNVGDWDVSQVTNMSNMFQGAKSFNQDISNWDISNVEYFENAPSDSSIILFSDTTSTTASISGFLVGSGMSSENVSKMFVGWKDKVNTAVQSINIGSIELNTEGATALRALLEASNIVVSWGGEEGVDDEPVFSDLPKPFKIKTEETRILNLWDYVSDIATPDNELEFKFALQSDSAQVFAFDGTNGELSITAPAYADTFFVAIQVANNENIVSLDTLTVDVSPLNVSVEDLVSELPVLAELNQNYPNPFNPSTVIRFGIPQSGEVRLEVFDLLGRRVATLVDNERKSAGYHQVSFDASNLASGIYFYRIVAGKYVDSKRMTLIK